MKPAMPKMPKISKATSRRLPGGHTAFGGGGKHAFGEPSMTSAPAFPMASPQPQGESPGTALPQMPPGG